MDNKTGIARVRIELLHMKQEEFWTAIDISRSSLQDYERGVRLPADVITRIINLCELRGVASQARRTLGQPPEPGDLKESGLDTRTWQFHAREDLAEILDSAIPKELKLDLARRIRQVYEKGAVGGWIGKKR